MNSRNLQRWPLKAIAMGGLLACAATSSSAVGLGRLRGAAWLGQPLDVTLQVQLEEGESPASLCFEAEVFHGDVRQDAARVRVSVESTADPRQVQVRLLSGTPVDEPVVTVYGRETCLSKSTRRYVLLSEIPAEALVAPAAPTPPNVAVGPIGAPASSPVAVATAPAAPASTASTASTVEPVRPRRLPPAPVVSKPAPKAPEKSAATRPTEPPAKPVAATPAPAKPKLKLDPVDTLSERVALLETRQAEAPAAPSPDVQRLKKLEDSLQNLVSMAAKNERAMAELRERLQQAEAEKYDNPLVYGLAGLLLAVLGGGAYVWRRQQQRASGSGPWWRESGPDQGASAPASATVTAVTAPAAAGATASTELAAGVMAATLLAAEELVPAVSAQPPAPQSASEVEIPPVADPSEVAPQSSEIDLDDLLAPEEPAAESVAEPLPVVDEPTQVPQKVVAEESVIPEFPSLGEVNIDVSHLSLSPVEEAVPVEPLLDFDLTPAVGEPESAEAVPKPERGTNA